MVVVEALMHFIDVAAVSVEPLAVQEDGGDIIGRRHVLLYVLCCVCIVGEGGWW